MLLLCTVAIALLLSCPPCVKSVLPLPHGFPTTNLSTIWIKDVNTNTNILQNNIFIFADYSRMQPIIVKKHSFDGVGYACGLYCEGLYCDSFLFAIAIFIKIDDFTSPEVVWSANRNNPVGRYASVELTNGGDLLLRDADGSLVWSTGTSGKAVAGLNLTEMGNLVLFDAKNGVVWQSFDHPANCLLPGQRLRIGQNLTAAASATDWSAGLYSLSMTDNGLVASLLSHPPQVYLQTKYLSSNNYAEIQTGVFRMRVSNKTRYMKLEDDGHLRVYERDSVADVLTEDVGECGYPMACGKYGICTNGQCSCPESSFRQIDNRLPDHGCSEVVPLTCNASDKHSFLDLNNVAYFNMFEESGIAADSNNTDVDSCKEACLRNCSCKAAMFVSLTEISNGSCYLRMEMFSLVSTTRVEYPSSVFLKIQIASTSSTSLLWAMLGLALGIIVLIGTAVFVCQRRKAKNEDVEEDYLDHVPGMPTRFSFEELTAATGDFSNKLGEGGFGSVYEGSLNDGTRIAVKHLGGVGQIRKSFLAEVESIGSIHHINLVRLIGFCAEKFHRLLVYEYMSNGSLEKWIYSGGHETSLDWNRRRKIILDIAKGLAYLHEDCRQKILHLDIKPQNILLNEHYNAKLADFGLSKLIDRNQSQVVTTMRGTPGYLAPEWLNAIITEKLDVYSFGVVVLEILTGRKIFEISRPEEKRYLLTLFKKKAEEGQWLDLVDECCEDEGCDLTEVEKMMKISAWCIQSDHEKRPSMSMVIKVMEGAVDVLKDIDYNLLIPRYLISTTFEAISCKDATPLLPSLLSGPR